MDKNRVILLIPHYNNINGLFTSLSSINKEENLDVLIVDDGSKVRIDEHKLTAAYLGKGTVFLNI